MRPSSAILSEVGLKTTVERLQSSRMSSHVHQSAREKKIETSAEEIFVCIFGSVRSANWL